MAPGIRNIPLKSLQAFFVYKGLKKIRTKGGHEMWTRNDFNRSFPLQTHVDPVPIFVVNKAFKLIGTNLDEYDAWRKN